MDGKRFETDLLKELRAQGLRAKKPTQTTFKDVGDIHLEDDIVLQAKAWQNISSALREGTKGAQLQAKHAGKPFGVTVIKKPRGAIRDAYVAMPLHVFLALLRSRQSP